MKKVRRTVVAGLLSAAMMVSMAACGTEFDAAEYVKTCLELRTSGETTESTKTEGRTEEQAAADYESSLNEIMAELAVFDLSEELSDGYRQMLKDLYSKVKYEVKDAKKMDDGDGYMVTVEIQDVTHIFDGLCDAVKDAFDGQETGQLSEQERYELAFQLLLDQLNERLAKVSYKDTRTLEIEVTSENSEYGISEKGYSMLENVLQETSEQLLSVVTEVSTIAGDIGFDAAAYVDACLDLLTKGEIAAYTKVADCTEEQATAVYDGNIESMVDMMSDMGLSDELLDGYRQFYKDLYSKAKYEVIDAKKMDDKDDYVVTVEIWPMTGIFNGLTDELATAFTEQATVDMSVDSSMNLMYQLMLDKLNERLANVGYKDAQTLEIEVVGGNNTYEITAEGYALIDDALLDVEN